MKTLALSNTNPNLKTYLVYPGLIYGYGEDLVRRLIETKPKNKYFFAVDHIKNRQLNNIIKKISKGVGNGLMENLDVEKNGKSKGKISHYADFSIDIKLKPSQ